MEVPGRTNRMKLSPPGLQSVNKNGGIAPFSSKPHTTLRFRSWTKTDFNNAGVALGFLRPGGSPRPGVSVKIQDNVVYQVSLNNTFDADVIKRHFSLGPKSGVSLLEISGE